MTIQKDYFGIDFGTTNSAVVSFWSRDEKSGVHPYRDERGLPMSSSVAIDKSTGEVITGRQAWEKRMELSESCEYIRSIKSFLGSERVWEAAGKKWSPVDIASEIFKTIKKTVNERAESDVLKNAIVAIPVGFSPQKRKKLRVAAENAGMKVSSFISEPTAAFLANYEELKSCSNIAVFDWGGGTLDISILHHSEGKVEELATIGLDVAGDRIDRKIAERIHDMIARKNGVRNIAFDDMPATSRDNLLVKSEKAKKDLAEDDAATISINNYGQFGAFRETLYYEWFVDIISPEVDLAIQRLGQAITQSGVGIKNIDALLMVGGSSNLRPLLEKLETLFGDKIYRPEEPMWSIAHGAALLSKSPGNYESNQHLGIVLSDGYFFELLAPGDRLAGWSRSNNFGIVDSSKEARIIFSEGADSVSSTLGHLPLEIPTYNFLYEQITLDTKVDEDLLFVATAKSKNLPKDYQRTWFFEQLKCRYTISPEWGMAE